MTSHWAAERLMGLAKAMLVTVTAAVAQAVCKYVTEGVLNMNSGTRAENAMLIDAIMRSIFKLMAARRLQQAHSR